MIYTDKIVNEIKMFIGLVFSSPEPKAQGELIVYQSSRRLSVCLCVNIFKLEYLRNHSTANIKAVRGSLWWLSVNKLSHIPELQSVSAVYENQ